MPGCGGAGKTSPETISTHYYLPNPLVFSQPTPMSEDVETANVLVAGAVAVDFACDYAPLSSENTETLPALHTSNTSVISQSLGGVGHNVALAASYVGSSVLFCSTVADDL